MGRLAFKEMEDRLYHHKTCCRRQDQDYVREVEVLRLDGSWEKWIRHGGRRPQWQFHTNTTGQPPSDIVLNKNGFLVTNFGVNNDLLRVLNMPEQAMRQGRWSASSSLAI